MRIFGFDITRRKEAPRGAQSVDDSRGWLTVFERWPGAWQADVQVDEDAVLANWAVFACTTLIAGDIGKLGLRLMQRGGGDTWGPTRSPAFSPVLEKPNAYQTRQKFFESWMLSKLSPAGNTYVLKVRDARGVVVAMHVLDPSRCKPLVAPDGSVWYELGDDTLAQVPGGRRVAVPASEIIHDRMWCLFHPLVGVGPIYACALAATQGLKIQGNSAKFFQNMSRPSGILTAPGKISDETAKRLKDEWERNFSGDQIGRVAVLGDGLAYSPMSTTPVDAQLTEQLKLTGEMVCSTFHVPAWKVGIGSRPPYQNAEIENQAYYADCLQTQIEGIEALLDDGLGLAPRYRAEFDVDDLFRMDSGTQIDRLTKAAGGAVMMPDEARQRLNLPPVPGGDTIYLQQQNYSLAALARRDAQPDPFASSTADGAAAGQDSADGSPQPDPSNARALEALHAELREFRAQAAALDARRSSQLAELLADVHREIESVQQVQRAQSERVQDEVAALNRRAALDAFSKALECQTKTSATH